MTLTGDVRFDPNHRFNRGFFGFLNGMEIKQVQGPYTAGVGEVFVPGGLVGDVFVPGGSLGQVLPNGG